MNRGLHGVKVGDKVIIETGRNGDPSEFQVIRVGHKYAYVSHCNREWKFKIETGSVITTYGAVATARTPGQYAYHTERRALLADLQEVGVETFSRGLRRQLTNAQLRAVLTIVQPDVSS